MNFVYRVKNSKWPKTHYAMEKRVKGELVSKCCKAILDESTETPGPASCWHRACRT